MVVVSVAAALPLVSCASTNGASREWVDVPGIITAGPAIHIVGTVHHLDIEGGVYVIRDANDVSYQPMNLPDVFKVDGLSVEAAATRRDNVASIGMAGMHVDLLRIRRRSN